MKLAKHTNYWKVVTERFFWLWHHLNSKLMRNQELHKLSKRITVYCSCLLSLELGLLGIFSKLSYSFWSILLLYLWHKIQHNTAESGSLFSLLTFSLYPIYSANNQTFHKSMERTIFPFYFSYGCRNS